MMRNGESNVTLRNRWPFNYANQVCMIVAIVERVESLVFKDLQGRTVDRIEIDKGQCLVFMSKNAMLVNVVRKKQPMGYY